MSRAQAQGRANPAARAVSQAVRLRQGAKAIGRIDQSPGSRSIYHLVSTTGEAVPMRTTAKLFTHGRSQAVRLPKEFRFEGKEVRISRIGDRVILEPVGEVGPMPWDQIDLIGDTPFMPEGRDQPAMPADRVVFDE
jgi:antitoxin VapB